MLIVRNALPLSTAECVPLATPNAFGVGRDLNAFKVGRQLIVNC